MGKHKLIYYISTGLVFLFFLITFSVHLATFGTSYNCTYNSSSLIVETNKKEEIFDLGQGYSCSTVLAASNTLLILLAYYLLVVAFLTYEFALIWRGEMTKYKQILIVGAILFLYCYKIIETMSFLGNPGFISIKKAAENSGNAYLTDNQKNAYNLFEASYNLEIANIILFTISLIVSLIFGNILKSGGGSSTEPLLA